MSASLFRSDLGCRHLPRGSPASAARRQSLSWSQTAGSPTSAARRQSPCPLPHGEPPVVMVRDLKG